MMDVIIAGPASIGTERATGRNMEQDDAEAYEKIVFPLTKDEDGYPPFDTERMWATRTPNGLYVIDNIPFFARGISVGDIVSARRVDDALIFDRVVIPSTNSVLRVLMLDKTLTSWLRDKLVELGCEWEGSHLPFLFSVHMPATANWDVIRTELLDGVLQKKWEVEEASMRTC